MLKRSVRRFVEEDRGQVAIFLFLLIAIFLATVFYFAGTPLIHELCSTGEEMGADQGTLNVLKAAWDKWPIAAVVFAFLAIVWWIHRADIYSRYYG